MTVIASTSNYGYPIIIGDLLISAEADRSIGLPTTSTDIDIFVNKTRKYKPVTLFRKIYVIKPNLVVGLAGSVHQMKFFLNELKMRSRLYDSFSKTELDAFLDEYPLENFDQSAALIHLADNSSKNPNDWNHIIYRFGNWMESASDLFEKAMATGSGLEEFVHQTTTNGTLYTGFNQQSFRHALSVNINHIVKLLGAEHISLYNIKDNWGAGYELTYFNGVSFNLLDRITYLICDIPIDQNGDLNYILPKTIMHYEYSNQDLHIQAFEIQSSKVVSRENSELITTNDFINKHFRVLPINFDYNALEQQFIPGHFRSQKIAICFNMIINDKSFFTPTLFAERPDISISYNGETILTITLPNDLLSKIKTTAKEAFLKF
jgi:hypothetical protein